MIKITEISAMPSLVMRGKISGFLMLNLRSSQECEMTQNSITADVKLLVLKGTRKFLTKRATAGFSRDQ